ncbi:MAG: hypothetical protein E7A50_06400 [Clostridiales bacterium]|nr:hypothetical protein [Clostridiales bacterium]
MTKKKPHKKNKSAYHAKVPSNGSKARYYEDDRVKSGALESGRSIPVRYDQGSLDYDSEYGLAGDIYARYMAEADRPFHPLPTGYEADYGFNPYDGYVSGESVAPLTHRQSGGQHADPRYRNPEEPAAEVSLDSAESSREIPARYDDPAGTYEAEYTDVADSYGAFLTEEAPRSLPQLDYAGDYGGNMYDCFYNTGEDEGYCRWQYGQKGPAPARDYSPEGPAAPEAEPAVEGDAYSPNIYDCYYNTGADGGYCTLHYDGPTAVPDLPIQPGPSGSPAAYDRDYGGNAYDCYYGTGQDDGFCAVDYGQAGLEAGGPDKTFRLHEKALVKMFDHTVNRVDGLLALKGRMEEAGDQRHGDVTLALEAVLAYGTDGKKVFAQITDELTKALAIMAGLTVRACHIEVLDIITRADFNKTYENTSSSDK